MTILILYPRANPTPIRSVALHSRRFPPTIIITTHSTNTPQILLKLYKYERISDHGQLMVLSMKLTYLWTQWGIEGQNELNFLLTGNHFATDKTRTLSITKFYSMFSNTRKPKSGERKRACVNSLTWIY